MTPFTVADAEAAAERLTAEHQAVFESLMRLEDHLGRKLLESAAPDGVTRERGAEVRYGFATLWTLYETYRAALLRVHAIRARRSHPTRADLEVDRTRSCRHLVVTAADGQRRKFRGDTPTLHPGIQGPGC